ncbi:MAG: hypothetical protein MRECE_21c013 [Mycoplasmataceae bacterium CE_OT135]|nr:MAG: hypothetical protein MRECE_21c013 [Mycoplasmataceae bacterium CE_OT135]
MKTYKNIEEINKEWKPYGFRVNEKGEILAIHEGKEYKFGTIKGFTDEKELTKQLEKDKKTEREREKEIKN